MLQRIASGAVSLGLNAVGIVLGLLAAMAVLVVGTARAFWRSAFAPPRVAHAIYDSNLFFRTSGAGSLTATETSSTLTINGTPTTGLALVIDIPKQSVGDTMQVTLRHSTDDSSYTDLLPLETLASTATAITTPVKYVRRFHTRLKYVKTVTTVAGTSPDFGAVVIRIGDTNEWPSLARGQNVNPNVPV